MYEKAWKTWEGDYCMSRQYIVDEDVLLRLIARDIELEQLEAAGVDNWSWYGEGREEFLMEAISGCIPEDEIPEDIDFEDVAKLELQDYILFEK